MGEFVANNFVIIAILAVLVVIALLSLPLIFVAGREPLLFSGMYSKRALIFSIINAVIITIVLLIGSFFIGIGVADESAGSAMMMLFKYSLAIGLIFGFTFPYSVIYLIHNNVSK